MMNTKDRIAELEAEVARVLGTEDAVYVPTGTMSNQIAVRTHTEPGDAVLLDGVALEPPQHPQR